MSILDLKTLEIILLTSYAVVVVTFSRLFAPFRERLYLFRCSMCLGMWVGFLVGIWRHFPDFWAIVATGLCTSAFAFIMHSVLVRLEK